MATFSSVSVRKIIIFIGLAASLVLTGCAQNFTPITKKQQTEVSAATVYTDQLGICEIFEREPQWYSAVVDMEKKWGTPIPLAMAFVKQESSFIHDARPIKRNAAGEKVGFLSTAYGYAQALDGTWADFKKTVTHQVDRTDFTDAMQFIGWYTSLSKQELALPYKEVGNHYLAYHEGRGGYKRGRHIGKTPLLNIANKVEKQAITYKAQLKNCQRRLDKNNTKSWFFARR